jgi:hypothetical protein
VGLTSCLRIIQVKPSLKTILYKNGRVSFKNYSNVGVMGKNKIVDMPLFGIPTCSGRPVGETPLVVVLSSEGVDMYLSILNNC